MKIKMLIALIGAILFCFGFGFGILNTVMDIESTTDTETETISHYGKISATCIAVGILLMAVLEA